ncbi:MAG: hypothetical protein IPM35_20275 [Myxococcales bacterium]|nr:hypothetical protein [Myxococcales bacterium]
MQELVPAATLLSFETGLLGLGSLATMACVEALVRGRASLPRLQRALLGFGLGLGVLALVWALAGGSLLGALSGWLGITGGYVVIMVEGGHGLSIGPVLAFVGLGLAALVLTVSRRFRSVPAAVLLAGALPLLGRAVIRSDAEHVYAALMPLAASLTVVSLDFAPRRPVFAALSALLVALFALGWFGSRREVPTAWAPSGFARVAAIAARRAPSRLGYDHDLLRIERYARGASRRVHGAARTRRRGARAGRHPWPHRDRTALVALHEGARRVRHRPAAVPRRGAPALELRLSGAVAELRVRR